MASLYGVGNTDGNVLTGNGAANFLVGLAGNDTLDGGAGADGMLGGTGNDMYVVDNAGDFVVESANEGTDTVDATVSYRLTANVENLALQGSADLQGYGNADANMLIGNAGTISSTATPVPTSCSAAPATTRTSSTMPAIR